ncbi:tight junction-associated protein 1-like [Actinia tenebrosa]|uniref:Tight junction-associated protein 1-like n=1 Tax=Actinia tenebrosa TaxID=6105 RepID=A0A6P8HYV6_ACTTE|nr:tight junction-associated protein 1-like [Actinia tenebrosa]
MAEQCMECGCTCSKCNASSECISLREEIVKLCKKLNESERRTQELELKLRESNLEKEAEHLRIQENFESYLEQNKRLKESYDQTVRQNQELESQVLKMADELQTERSRFDEALMAMTERLIDATEKMNTMEKETVKSRKDCALVVQLLKCNQSLDRNFISKKLDSFPSELKGKLQEELKLKDTSEKTEKSRSMSAVDSNDNATVRSSLHKQPFAQRRSKSVTFSMSEDEIIQNGFHQN